MRLASLLLVTSAGLAHAADTCTPSHAMLIVDKSSSMTATIGGVSKWTIAKNAIDDVTSAYESSIAFGLMVFPSPNQCAPGTVFVDPDLATHDAIVSGLGAAPPSAGNWTPMSQTLDAAANVPALTSTANPAYVILLTDGWQWCSPYDASTRFDPVASVQNLKALGITTYVVGFGDEVDALTLNKMAVAAGTSLASCDPTGNTPTAANPCYFRADDPVSLESALGTIAVTVSAEICDGIDNNCDGQIDEGLTRACSSSCGSGVEMCADGAWTGCDAPQPSAEICDGVDNDCDGVTDPGCSCIAGDTQSCGACLAGTQTCQTDGTWGDCVGGAPQPDLCDGVDNDCDGVTDPGCACTDGDVRVCGPTTNVGQCHPGTQTCDLHGEWSACDAVGPSSEVCDGVDNDCDGQIDEGTTSTDDVPQNDLCPSGQMCTDGTCVTATPDPPIDPGDGQVPGGEPSACGCRVGGDSPTPLAGFLGAIVLGLVVRGRRKR